MLLYSSNRWVVIGEILKVLERFYHQAARRIKGLMVTHWAGREWEYPPVVKAMESSELQPIGEYIKRRHVTISERVAYHLIYELCTEAEKIPRTSQMVRWWEQDAVNEPEE